MRSIDEAEKILNMHFIGRVVFINFILFNAVCPIAIKNGLSEDSMKQNVYEHSEFLMVMEDELGKLAVKLIYDRCNKII